MHDMKDQITVRLPKQLTRALDAAARRSGRRRSEVIRLSLVAFLTPGTAGHGQPIDRIRGLIGSLESEIPDLAENHRKYILESLKNAR
jgi:RHH-type transcriptional regulator, rel operon repressor / antitoxin RelB